jgi:hypothetical protein|tara:strand:+ start:653 stop:1321 length:669 start_codon:yes stop_codon:yes gene_type:complete
MAQAPNVFTTPKGVAQYPWLSKPDTKFNEEGEYKVNLVLTKEDAAPIIEQINVAFSENLKEEVKKNKGKEIKTANPPYTDELDDDGKPTGNVIIKFKSKALYPPAIFDAKGDVMKDSNIWGGSEIRVNGSIAPYYVKLIGAGVALRLRAVQVIQYVEGGTGSADRFGFEEVDGGFVQEAPAKEVSPEIKSEEAFDEPTVRETKPALDNTDDISGIINKWGQA